MKKRNLELYLHIPFCVRKCNYCDFFSASGTEEEQEALKRAMDPNGNLKNSDEE